MFVELSCIINLFEDMTASVIESVEDEVINMVGEDDDAVDEEEMRFDDFLDENDLDEVLLIFFLSYFVLTMTNPIKG